MGVVLGARRPARREGSCACACSCGGEKGLSVSPKEVRVMADTDGLYDTSEPAMQNRVSRFKARLATSVESPAERAAHVGLLIVADFYIAILQAKSVDEVLTIRQLISEVLASMESAERAALEKADNLCGAKS